MDDNLIVRIATIQAIVMSLLFFAVTCLQINGQRTGMQVSILLLLWVWLGGIQQIPWQNFASFWPPPLGWQFLYPEQGQKIFFNPLSPHFVHLVIECPLMAAF